MKQPWEYGFLLSYPDGKSAITGIIYELWHSRHVGKEGAKERARKDTKQVLQWPLNRCPAYESQ